MRNLTLSSMADATTIDSAEQEEDRAMRLNSSRRGLGRLVAASHRSVETKINSAEAILMLMFGGIMDLMILIPVVGVVIKVCASGAVFLWQKLRGLDLNKPWFLKWMSGISAGGSFIPGSLIVAILLIIILNSAFVQQALNKIPMK